MSEYLRELWAQLARLKEESGDSKTLRAEKENKNLNRAEVFDPALRPNKAIRAGEPSFDSPELGRQWHAIRLLVLHHILKVISNSDHASQLILRGSALMATWFGDKARLPGDLDWVITPDDMKLNDPKSKSLLWDLEKLLRGSCLEADHSVVIPDYSFAATEIWTYEKAPGKRIIVPWHSADSTLNGTIQMDFVFGEIMPSEPIWSDVTLADQPPLRLQAATQEQSLAWKLLWLATDDYAMGKDLYDSVILAESVPVTLEVLKKTFSVGADELGDRFQFFNQQKLRGLYVEWDDFQKEYPEITGTDDEWKKRLVSALDPLWEEINKESEMK